MAEPGAVKRGLNWLRGIAFVEKPLPNGASLVYLKDYNQLPNTSENDAGTINLREAMAHAAFFEKLRQQGVYPPEAGFAVCKSADGHPGVIAIMPEMRVAHHDKTRHAHFSGIIAELLGNANAVHWDVKDYAWLNCGIHDNHQTYFFDLHAVHPYHRRKVLEWYERHLAEKAHGKAAK